MADLWYRRKVYVTYMGSKKCFKGNSMQLKILTLWYLLFFWKIHPKAFGNLYSTTLYTFGRSSVLLILHYYKAMMPPLAMPRSSLLRVQTPVDTQARCVTDTGSPPPKYDTTHCPTSGGSPLLVIQDECSHRIPPPSAPCNVQCCKTIHRFHNRLYNHGEGPY